MTTCGILGAEFADVHSLLADDWLLLVTVSRMLLADGQSGQLYALHSVRAWKI
jgi:hypothetical protein